MLLAKPFTEQLEQQQEEPTELIMLVLKLLALSTQLRKELLEELKAWLVEHVWVLRR